MPGDSKVCIFIQYDLYHIHIKVRCIMSKAVTSKSGQCAMILTIPSTKLCVASVPSPEAFNSKSCTEKSQFIVVIKEYHKMLCNPPCVHPSLHVYPPPFKCPMHQQPKYRVCVCVCVLGGGGGGGGIDMRP